MASAISFSSMVSAMALVLTIISIPKSPGFVKVMGFFVTKSKTKGVCKTIIGRNT